MKDIDNMKNKKEHIKVTVFNTMDWVSESFEATSKG
jgi:hypothetical protein